MSYNGTTQDIDKQVLQPHQFSKELSSKSSEDVVFVEQFFQEPGEQVQPPDWKVQSVSTSRVDWPVNSQEQIIFKLKPLQNNTLHSNITKLDKNSSSTSILSGAQSNNISFHKHVSHSNIPNFSLIGQSTQSNGQHQIKPQSSSSVQYSSDHQANSSKIENFQQKSKPSSGVHNPVSLFSKPSSQSKFIDAELSEIPFCNSYSLNNPPIQSYVSRLQPLLPKPGLSLCQKSSQLEMSTTISKSNVSEQNPIKNQKEAPCSDKKPHQTPSLQQITKICQPLWQAIDSLMHKRLPHKIWETQSLNHRQSWQKLNGLLNNIFHHIDEIPVREKLINEALKLTEILSQNELPTENILSQEFKDLWDKTLEFAIEMGLLTGRARNVILDSKMRVCHSLIRLWWFEIVLTMLSISPSHPEPNLVKDVKKAFDMAPPLLNQLKSRIQQIEKEILNFHAEAKPNPQSQRVLSKSKKRKNLKETQSNNYNNSPEDIRPVVVSLDSLSERECVVSGTSNVKCTVNNTNRLNEQDTSLNCNKSSDFPIKSSHSILRQTLVSSKESVLNSKVNNMKSPNIRGSEQDTNLKFSKFTNDQPVSNPYAISPSKVHPVLLIPSPYLDTQKSLLDQRYNALTPRGQEPSKIATSQTTPNPIASTVAVPIQVMSQSTATPCHLPSTQKMNSCTKENPSLDRDHAALISRVQNKFNLVDSQNSQNDIFSTGAVPFQTLSQNAAIPCHLPSTQKMNLCSKENPPLARDQTALLSIAQKKNNFVTSLHTQNNIASTIVPVQTLSQYTATPCHLPSSVLKINSCTKVSLAWTSSISINQNESNLVTSHTSQNNIADPVQILSQNLATPHHLPSVPKITPCTKENLSLIRNQAASNLTVTNTNKLSNETPQPNQLEYDHFSTSISRNEHLPATSSKITTALEQNSLQQQIKQEVVIEENLQNQCSPSHPHQLEQHNSQIQPQTPPTDIYSCPCCKKPCGTEMCLLGHLNIFHTEKIEFECIFCKRKIVKFDLLRHLKVEHAASNPRFVCGGTRGDVKGWKCSFTTDLSADLISHCDSHHMNTTEFECCHCGNLLKTATDLVYHQLIQKRTCNEAKNKRKSTVSNISSDKPARANQNINKSSLSMSLDNSEINKIIPPVVNTGNKSASHTNAKFSKNITSNYKIAEKILLEKSTPKKGQDCDEPSTSKSQEIESPELISSPEDLPIVSLSTHQRTRTTSHGKALQDTPMKHTGRTVKIMTVSIDAKIPNIEKQVVHDEPPLKKPLITISRIKRRARKNSSIQNKQDGITEVGTQASDSSHHVRNSQCAIPEQQRLDQYNDSKERCFSKKDSQSCHTKRKKRKASIIDDRDNLLEYCMTSPKLSRTFSHHKSLLDCKIKEIKTVNYVQKLQSNSISQEIDTLQLSCRCPECPEILPSVFHLGLHLPDHDVYRRPDRLEPAFATDNHPRCGICGYFANGHQDFEYHITRHANERRFICVYCCDDFDEIKSVKRHCCANHRGEKFEYICRKLYYSQLAQSAKMTTPLQPTVKVSDCNVRLKKSSQLQVNQKNDVNYKNSNCIKRSKRDKNKSKWPKVILTDIKHCKKPS